VLELGDAATGVVFGIIHNPRATAAQVFR